MWSNESNALNPNQTYIASTYPLTHFKNNTRFAVQLVLFERGAMLNLHIHIEQWVHTRNDRRCGHIIAVTTEFSLELNNFQMQSRFQRREEQYLKYSVHRPTKTSCGCALM